VFDFTILWCVVTVLCICVFCGDVDLGGGGGFVGFFVFCCFFLL